MEARTLIEKAFKLHAAIVTPTLEACGDTLANTTIIIEKALKAGRKILLFGNGGSAADAQHIAAEFVVRFMRNRRALPAIALTTDTSVLTAIGNDLSFTAVFSRQLQAIGQEGDVAIGISTSGNSPNVLSALVVAKDMGMATVGLTGRDGGGMPAVCDYILTVPCNTTARIQEMHILMLHSICDILDTRFSDSTP